MSSEQPNLLCSQPVNQHGIFGVTADKSRMLLYKLEYASEVVNDFALNRYYTNLYLLFTFITLTHIHINLNSYHLIVIGKPRIVMLCRHDDSEYSRTITSCTLSCIMAIMSCTQGHSLCTDGFIIFK